MSFMHITPALFADQVTYTRQELVETQHDDDEGEEHPRDDAEHVVEDGAPDHSLRTDEEQYCRHHHRVLHVERI